MRVMQRLWIAAVCLAAYGTGLAQQAGASAREAERADIERQRAAIAATQAQEEKACWQRFAVEDCLKDVRARARAQLAPLRAHELELNQQERQERAAERLRAIEAKRANAPPPAPVQAHTRKPVPDAALRQQEGARAKEAAERAAQQRQRQADHARQVQEREAAEAERRSKAEQAWSEKQRRAQQRREEAQQSAQPQRGQPLPVPPAGASPLGR